MPTEPAGVRLRLPSLTAPLAPAPRLPCRLADRYGLSGPAAAAGTHGTGHAGAGCAGHGDGRQYQAAVATRRHLVVVVAPGVELLGLDPPGPAVNPPELLVLPVPELLLPAEPVPDPPIELVLPGVLPLLVSPLLPLVLLPLPAVLPVLGLVLEGLVVLLLEEEEPGAPASRLLQALSERAAATASVATAIWVREVFIRETP